MMSELMKQHVGDHIVTKEPEDEEKRGIAGDDIINNDIDRCRGPWMFVMVEPSTLTTIVFAAFHTPGPTRTDCRRICQHNCLKRAKLHRWNCRK